MAIESVWDMKESSLVLRNSLAKSGDETTTHGTEPRRRENKGPWRAERRWKERCRRGPRRWKWPSIGKAIGLGGRRLVWKMEVKIGGRRRNKKTKKARSSSIILL